MRPGKERGRPAPARIRGSKFLGIKERVEEIGGEAGGHDAAKDEIEHGVSLCVSGPAGVETHEAEEADPENEIDDVEHGSVSLGGGDREPDYAGIRIRCRSLIAVIRKK
jgi:hypothetical protein